MRRGFVVAVAALAVCLFGALGATSEAAAQQTCTTQGAYALGLAQTLGFDAATVEAAVSALNGVGIAPEAGWQPEECLTDAVVAQVRSALERAAANGVLPAGTGADAADRALAGVGGDRDHRAAVSNFRPAE